MTKQVFWLSDAEWRRIEPLLPRGRKGLHGSTIAAISFIVFTLRYGAHWRGCP